MKPETQKTQKGLASAFFRRVSGSKFHVSRSRGFSLIEMLAYVAILTAALVFIVGGMVRISTSYRALKDAKNISHAAADILSRLVYEVRQSSAIDTANSTFTTSPGRLSLVQSDGTREFYIASSTLRLRENGVDQGSLTPAGATVTGFTVYQLQNSVSQAVAITLTLASRAGVSTTSETFRTTAVMRNVY
jgi:Tfp pilus assembly protein FimT